MFLRSDSLVLAEGDSKAPSPPTLSSLTVEPHDLWPRPETKRMIHVGLYVYSDHCHCSLLEEKLDINNFKTSLSSNFLKDCFPETTLIQAGPE